MHCLLPCFGNDRIQSLTSSFTPAGNAMTHIHSRYKGSPYPMASYGGKHDSQDRRTRAPYSSRDLGPFPYCPMQKPLEETTYQGISDSHMFILGHTHHHQHLPLEFQFAPRGPDDIRTGLRFVGATSFSPTHPLLHIAHCNSDIPFYPDGSSAKA